MDVPKSDLGDVIAWSLRGGRVGGRGGGELRKATVMMKHFLFNESGGNHGRNDFCAFFFFKKESRSVIRCLAALTGHAACKPLPPTNLSFSSSEEQPPPSGGVRRDRQPDQSQIFKPPPPDQTASPILSRWRGGTNVAPLITSMAGSGYKHRPPAEVRVRELILGWEGGFQCFL